jgi:hypothetical protein
MHTDKELRPALYLLNSGYALVSAAGAIEGQPEG